MPIDASVPLSVRPPEVPDLSGMYVNALKIKAAIDDQKMQPVRDEALRQEVETRRIENQQRQRALKASEAIAEAFKANTKVGEDGTPALDSAGVVKHLTDNGWGPEALKVRADMRAEAKAAFDEEESRIKLAAIRSARLGALTGSVVTAIRTAGTDEAKRRNAYEIALPQAVSTALSEKLISEEQAAQMLKHPYGPDVESQFSNWANGAMDFEKQLSAYNARMREVRESLAAEDTHAKNEAELPGIQATADQKVKDLWSSKLRQARSRGQYEAMLRNAPAWVADELRTIVPQFDPATSPKALQDWGLTSAQAATAESAEATRAETARYHDLSLAVRKQLGDRGLTATEIARVGDKHDALIKQAEEARNTADQLDSLIGTPDGAMVTMKDGKQVAMSSSVRSQIAREFMQTKTRAATLENQAKQMRQRYGLDENGMPSGAPASRTEGQQSAAPYSTAHDGNPLNITLGAATQKWVDSGDATVKTIKGDDGKPLQILSFKDPIKGLQAGTDLLFGPNYSDKKAGRALMEWSNDNYGPEVVRQAGIDPRATIGSLNAQQKEALVAAMAKREGWTAPVPSAQPAAPSQQPQQSKPSPVGAPAAKPQQQKAPNPAEVISVKLPNGKFLSGPRGKVQEALKEAGYSLND